MFTSSLTTRFINGITHNPNTNTIIPIKLYDFLYNCIRLFIFSLSSIATGLYILKIIAVPIPNSAKDNIANTLVNKPLTPK